MILNKRDKMSLLGYFMEYAAVGQPFDIPNITPEYLFLMLNKHNRKAVIKWDVSRTIRPYHFEVSPVTSADHKFWAPDFAFKPKI